MFRIQSILNMANNTHNVTSTYIHFMLVCLALQLVLSTNCNHSHAQYNILPTPDHSICHINQ